MRSIIIFALVIFLLTLGGLLFYAQMAGATDYFVDFQSPGVEDGLTPGTAWLSGETALENTYAAGGGHTVWVKPSHFEVATSHWTVVSSGVAGAPIIIRTDLLKEYWPGSTGTTASFTTGAFDWVWTGEDYWRIQDLIFQDNTGAEGDLSFGYDCSGMQVVDCTFYDTNAGNEFIYGFRGSMSIDGCVFDGRNSAGVGATEGYGISVANRAIIANSTFDALASGIYVTQLDSRVFNCEFGLDEVNTADITVRQSGVVRMHDCLRASTGSTTFSSPYGPSADYVTQYYRDGQGRPIGERRGNGYKLSSSYYVTRSGGADWSIGCSATTANIFASYSSARIPVLEYAVDCAAAESRDYTVYAYRSEDWAAVPTEDQLYMEVIYQGVGKVASQTSTETLSSAKTWTALTCTSISPTYAGPVLVSVYLGINDADGSIYVDPLLVTSTTETYNPTYQYGLPLAGYIAPPAAGGGRIILIGEKQKPPAVWQWLASAGGVR